MEPISRSDRYAPFRATRWITGKDHHGKVAGRDAGAQFSVTRRQLVRRASFRASFATATSTTSFVHPRHQLTDGPPFEEEATSYSPPAFQRKAHKKICDPQCRALCYSGRRHAASLLPRHRHRRLRLHQQRPRHKQTKKTAQCALRAASATVVSADEYAPSALGPLGARHSGLHGCPCSLALLTPPVL